MSRGSIGRMNAGGGGGDVRRAEQGMSGQTPFSPICQRFRGPARTMRRDGAGAAYQPAR